MKQMRRLHGKQILAKLLLTDKLSSGGKKKVLFLFTCQPPQFIASQKVNIHSWQLRQT